MKYRDLNKLKPTNEGQTKDYIGYIELAIALGLSVGAVLVISKLSNGADLPSMIRNFLGVFLLLFASIKFFNMENFSEVFKQYDLIGKNIPAFAHLYIWIQLFAGSFNLFNLYPLVINSLVAILMLISFIGVLDVVSKNNLELKTKKLGTTMQIPVVYFLLLENIVAGLLSLYILVQVIF